jgi:membrane protease YdiL (CAAX protease family)
LSDVRFPGGDSALRGFGPRGILAASLIVLAGLAGPWAGAAAVLVWARLSGTPKAALGLSPPTRPGRTILLGTAAGALLKIVMKAIVMPLLAAPPVNSAYHFLEGNAAALPRMILTIVVSAGFGEEILYRGWLFERLGRAWGVAPAARAATVALTSLLFAAAHLADQGVPGAMQAVLTGAVTGAVYLATGTLWLPIAMHIAFDLTAVAILYFGLEQAVAHLLF